MALLFITRSWPRSQHRPCAQAKRNRAGREMTHPLLENASSPGSLPQQPSERNWAPKPPAGLAFSQQTRGPLLCPQVPQRSGPPAPPTGSCLSRPKKICVRRRGACPCPRTCPPLSKHPVCVLPPTLHPGRPQNLSMGVSLQKACTGGRWEKGHPRTQPKGGRDSSEGLSPTILLGPEPRLGELHSPLGNSGSGERTPRLASPREG